MKAYVLSRRNGVVQIGKVVYCVATHKAFEVKQYASKKDALFVCDVPEASFESAEYALTMDYYENFETIDKFKKVV